VKTRFGENPLSVNPLHPYEGEKNQLPLIPKVFLPPGVNFINIFGANAEQLLRIKFLMFLWQQHLGKMCQNIALGVKAIVKNMQ
jgi:hypothetical protein